jgi:hypothetical protein
MERVEHAHPAGRIRLAIDRREAMFGLAVCHAPTFKRGLTDWETAPPVAIVSLDQHDLSANSNQIGRPMSTHRSIQIRSTDQ